MEWETYAQSGVQDVPHDPDPFTLALGILSIAFGGGAFLEARRQRQFLERQARESFRAAWYDANRTLIHARRVVEEFNTYIREDGYGGEIFRFGSVRLTMEPDRARQFKRLHANTMTTAKYMADHLDVLAQYLGADYQPLIDKNFDRLKRQSEFPCEYQEVISLAREALVLYEELLRQIGRNEGFDS